MRTQLKIYADVVSFFSEFLMEDVTKLSEQKRLDLESFIFDQIQIRDWDDKTREDVYQMFDNDAYDLQTAIETIVEAYTVQPVLDYPPDFNVYKFRGKFYDQRGREVECVHEIAITPDDPRDDYYTMYTEDYDYAGEDFSTPTYLFFKVKE